MSESIRRSGTLSGVLLGAVTLLASTAAGLMVGSIPDAGAAPTWSSTAISTPADIGTTISLNAVSCPSATFCVAVGDYETTGGVFDQPLIETYSSGTWTASTPPVPSGENYAPLIGVSCVSTTSCVAIGNDAPKVSPDGADQYAFAETLSSGSWSVSGPFAYPSSGIVVTMGGISCTASTACVAVGEIEISGGEVGLTYTLSGSSWTVATGVNPSGTSTFVGLQGVSCTTSTACVAVGFISDSPNYISQLLIETLSDGSWTATEPADPSAGVAGAELSGVSCTGATSCVAVGSYSDSSDFQHGLAESLSGSTWTQTLTNLDPDANGSSLNGVTCTGATACVAAGNYYDSDNNEDVLIATLSGSTWTATTSINPTGALSPSLSGVSCYDASDCFGVGTYNDVGGDQLPFYSTNAGSGPPPPPPTTQLAVSAPSSMTAGTAADVTITAEDSTGATTTGYSGTVHFTSSDGQAVLPADSTLTNGVGTFSVTLKTAGAQTITATDTVTSSITGTSGSITVGPAAATSLVVSAPSSATAGNSFSFSVTALDAFGNTATGYSGTVHFTSSDGQAVLPADSTLTNGAGTFSATLATAGDQTITATDTVNSSITGTSGSITVGPAAADHFVVSAPSSATAGKSFSFSVTALDAFGNTATGYSGTVQFTSSDGQAVLPADSTLTNGAGTFSATLKTAGDQTITATDTVNSSITGTSGSITVGPAAADHFVVSAPSSATAGKLVLLLCHGSRRLW